MADTFTNVANLAIPFGLLFAVRTMQKKKVSVKGNKPAARKQKGGTSGGHCVLCARSSGGNANINTISNEINEILGNK